MNSIIKDDITHIVNSIESWGKFRDKCVLITGANGFIPAYMVETIVFLNENTNLNIKLIALVRNKSKALKRFPHLEFDNNVQFLVQDVCNEINISEKVDYIIHAASQASPKFYGTDPIGTLSANSIGTFNVLRFAEQQKDNLKSMLYFSSAEVYGDTSNFRENIKENNFGSLDCMSLRACYAESKRIGETMCNSWFHQKGMPTKIIRIFHTYGPGMDLEDGRVFADFVKNVVQGKDIEIKSDGMAVRAFCYLADTVAAAFKVLLDAPAGEVFNVGNEDCQTDMNNLANILATLSVNQKLTIKRCSDVGANYLQSNNNKIVPDTSKLKTLGWNPKYSLNDGFLRTINSYVHK